MLREVKLKTLHMYDDYDPKQKDYLLWKKVAEYMDGEIALILDKGSACEDGYLFLALRDQVKDKELHYMMEQDSTIGCFINDRDGFDHAWDSENYDTGSCFYLEPQYLIFSPREE